LQDSGAKIWPENPDELVSEIELENMAAFQFRDRAKCSGYVGRSPWANKLLSVGNDREATRVG
jgi:hypothetical protein